MRLYSVPRIHYFDQTRSVFFTPVNKRELSSLDDTSPHTVHHCSSTLSVLFFHHLPAGWDRKVKVRNYRFEESTVAPAEGVGDFGLSNTCSGMWHPFLHPTLKNQHSLRGTDLQKALQKGFVTVWGSLKIANYPWAQKPTIDEVINDVKSLQQQFLRNLDSVGDSVKQINFQCANIIYCSVC